MRRLELRVRAWLKKEAKNSPDLPGKVLFPLQYGSLAFYVLGWWTGWCWSIYVGAIILLVFIGVFFWVLRHYKPFWVVCGVTALLAFLASSITLLVTG